MDKQGLLNKISFILQDLKSQHLKLTGNVDRIAEIDLDLLLANAHFLVHHLEVLKKINGYNSEVRERDEMLKNLFNQSDLEELLEVPIFKSKEIYADNQEPLLEPIRNKDLNSNLLQKSEKEIQETIKKEHLIEEPLNDESFKTENSRIENLGELEFERNEDFMKDKKEASIINIQSNSLTNNPLDIPSGLESNNRSNNRSNIQFDIPSGLAFNNPSNTQSDIPPNLPPNGESKNTLNTSGNSSSNGFYNAPLEEVKSNYEFPLGKKQGVFAPELERKTAFYLRRVSENMVQEPNMNLTSLHHKNGELGNGSQEWKNNLEVGKAADEKPMNKVNNAEAPKNFHELLGGQRREPSLLNKLGNLPVKDIRKAIGLNEHLLFIKNLFHGEPSVYDKTLTKIDLMHSSEEAFKFLNDEIAGPFHWENQKAVAELFKNIVSRKFAGGR